MQPLFITFEGLDGSGKSTHLRRAVRWLESRGVPCEATQEPGGTPVGEAIRAIFLDARWERIDATVETLLVFASRRQQLLEVIEPALRAGRHVLCDRFTDSTVVYQGHGGGVPLERIAEIDRIATGSRVPDRTLLFDLSPEVARDRSRSGRRSRARIDRFDAEDLEFYQRLREAYLGLARSEPRRFAIIDSSGAAETTERRVQEALADLVEVG